MPKNYYFVLGVPKDATMDDIKEAYRRLAKEFHPDYYGNNQSPFVAIQEAYSVLSDPSKRKNYDISFMDKGKRAVASLRNKRFGENIEPLIPEMGQRVFEDVQVRSLSTHRFHFGRFFDSVFKNFVPTIESLGNRSENLNIVVTLTPFEALRGGQVNIALPAEPVCPSCFGRGETGFYECWRCGGDGYLTGEYPVTISYPGGISDYHTVIIPLKYQGVKNMNLTIQFRVRE